MAEENDAEGSDVEAEMLRMMQEELGGDEEGEASAAEDTAEGGGDVDSLLEEEMLKAMEQESGGAGGGGADPMGSLSSLMGGGPVSDYADEAEGIDKLADVEVEVTVELGENLIPIQDIMEWTSGSVVELQCQEHEPVRVMLNGSPFATGEIVVVGDTFGVRIVGLIDENSHH